MIDFKTLAIGAAVFSSVVFAMPTSSEALPRAVVKSDGAGGTILQVHSRRSCRHGRCYVRLHRHDRYYNRSQYGCPPYYGYYLPRYGADKPCKSRYRPQHGYYRRSGDGFYFGFPD